MKQRFVIVLSLLITLTSMNAQASLDPAHSIYRDIEIWYNKGYVTTLPPQKPYPLQYLRSLLEEIKTKANSRELIAVERYLKELNENGAGLALHQNTYTDGENLNTISGGQLSGAGMIHDYVSIAGRAGAFLNDNFHNPVLPRYKETGVDMVDDAAEIGPFDLMNSAHTITAFGTDKIWFQSGINRSSFGHFAGENVIMNESAPQAGHFSLTWMFDNLVFTKTTLALTATDSNGQGRYPSKYLVTHGLQYNMFSWLELGIYETLVYGGRLDLLYLIPFSQLFYAQGMSSFKDNNFIGVTGTIRFPENINLKGQFLLDDAHFNDIIRLDFDTKYKLALQAELSWTPFEGIVKNAAAGYTMVTPYMYTHRPDTQVNADGSVYYNYKLQNEDHAQFTNYTQLGVSLGSNLAPNSDMVNASVDINLPWELDLNIFGLFTRHGNASHSLPDSFYGYDIVWLNESEYYLELGEAKDESGAVIVDSATTYTEGVDPLFKGDGSILDHGVLPMDKNAKSATGTIDHWESAWESTTPFLQQDILEKVLQTGFKLSRAWDTPYGLLEGNLEYTFQYIWNKNLVKDATELKNYLAMGVSFYF